MMLAAKPPVVKNKVRVIRIDKVVITVVIVGAIGIGIGKKIFEYAAAPAQAKDCDYIFPQRLDQTKSTDFIVDDTSTLVFEQQGGTVNDASCLNKTTVYGVIKISNAADVQQAVRYAKAHDLKITPAGQHHSMGGQSFVPGGLVLDTRSFNTIQLADDHQTITVQPGATWQQIQNYLDPQGLAVKAMQSINIFSVGGTLSVNAHGIAYNPGSVASTVRSLRVLLSDGTIQTASPTENVELFKHVLGGYGLFGIILEAELEVVPNELYDKSVEYMDYHDFPNYYQRNIANNDQIGLFYGRLSISPDSYLTETSVRVFTTTTTSEPLPALVPEEHTALTRFVINFSKTGGPGRWLRWTLEKAVEPSWNDCITRNQAMSDKEVCLVTRNQSMYNSMGYLQNRLPDTDILQEYFIPQDHMIEFVDGLRATVQKRKANLLNATIRIVPKDTITALPYAKTDMFAFVLYINQGLNQDDSTVVANTTTDLIDLATGLGGTFYLPYQLHYSPTQLRQAYPEIDEVFAYKKTVDPDELFSNTWYHKYHLN